MESRPLDRCGGVGDDEVAGGPDGAGDAEGGGGLDVIGDRPGGGLDEVGPGARRCSEKLNMAVTSREPVMMRPQGPPPEQSPCQPLNAKPFSGVAVRTTRDPAGKLAVQR